MSDWLENYKKDREKASSNRIPVLKLKPLVDSAGSPRAEDAKIARIRFITGADDAQSFWVHAIPKRSRLGKMFSSEVYCPQMNEGNNCKYCDKDDFPKRKLYFYVYCTDILHVQQDKDKKWLEVEYLDDKYYSEPVNGPMILITGVGKGGSTEDKFLMWNKRFKTLLDRNYDWTREGLGLDVHYDLVPDNEKSEELVEVSNVKKSLPDIKSYVEKMISKVKEEEGKSEEDGVNGDDEESNGEKEDLEKILFD